MVAKFFVSLWQQWRGVPRHVWWNVGALLLPLIAAFGAAWLGFKTLAE